MGPIIYYAVVWALTAEDHHEHDEDLLRLRERWNVTESDTGHARQGEVGTASHRWEVMSYRWGMTSCMRGWSTEQWRKPSCSTVRHRRRSDRMSWPSRSPALDRHHKTIIGRVSYIRISLCCFCFRWKTVSFVQASMQHLMHHVTVSLQQSKITLQNNCINNTSITQPTLSFYLWLKM